jgi:hypothetical protein
MSYNFSWLPELVHNPGNWNEYCEILYQFFFQDFVASKPTFGNKKVRLKREPVTKNKEATFWHFISENLSGSTSENERIPDFRRCERIRWPKPVMEQYPSEEKIRWWKTKRQSRRGTSQRIVLALQDFCYIVIVEERADYVLPWTQYLVEESSRREKLKREYENYWAAQKTGDTV